MATIALMLSSCGNPSSSDKHSPNVEEDSIVHAPKRPLMVGEVSNYESKFDLSQEPQAENEVLKGLDFGISKSKFKNIEKKYLSQFEDAETSGYHIGDFGFYDITPYFLNDSLYRVDINGFNSLHYSEIITEIDVVKKIFNEKYGSPVYEVNAPQDKELEENTGVCIAEWKAGKKVIQLCFFDFSKAVHSNLLKLIIFREDKMQEKNKQDAHKRKEYSKANTDKI